MVELTGPAQRVPARASARTRLTALVTRVGLGSVTEHIGTSTTGVAVSRGLIAALMATAGRTPRGTSVVQVRDGSVVGEWVYGAGVDRRSESAVLYLHGSAYMMCSPATHRSFVARLSTVLGMPCFVPEYRLAPEHRFPSAADDVDAAWQWMLDRGYEPENLIVAGDSAGGHLTGAFVLNRAADGERGPAAAVLLSPVVDVTFGLSAQQERRHRDPMITAAAARRLVDLYTRDADLSDRRLELDYRAAADTPPMLVQAGGAEMLSADSRHFVAQVNARGGRAELEVWPGQMHVFQALPRLTPDADAALLRIRDFVDAALRTSTATTREGVA
ncbi:MAG: alpha/beta hydrolase [Gordonia sp. (in: high G+C Gram-positive bacteria)]|nr:alpha/beta hydrolase [Gordonia sp. (in: high G+C Gram-positive bacteria)]